MALTSSLWSMRYPMSGMMTSTPRSSSSGNMIPASTTMIVPLQRNAIMCIPNSPRPPSGMTSILTGLIIHTKKFVDRQRFGADIDGNSGTAKNVGEVVLRTVRKNGAEIVDELLAPRGESAMNEVGEGGEVGDVRLPIEANDRGVDFGWRRERGGGNGESPGRHRVILDENRERTVVRRSGFGADALRDFFLKHDRDVGNSGPTGDENAKQCRSDVVRQIADHMIRG